MDINELIELINGVGFPIVISLLGYVLYRESLKQASKRDATNAELFAQQVKILGELTKNTLEARVAQIETRDDVKALKVQNEHAEQEIKTHIDKAFTTVAGDISTKLDSHHTALLGKFGSLVTSVTSVQNALTDIKKDIILAIDTLVEKREEKPHEKIPIVNSNYHGVDG